MFSSHLLGPLLVLSSSAVALAQYSSDVDLNDLESRNFILPNGEPYRDLLTMGAAQAVSQFATRFESTRDQTVSLEFVFSAEPVVMTRSKL
jgi:hypothetical protein